MAKNKLSKYIKRAKKAFTLLEVIVAMSIIGLIVGVSTLAYSQAKKTSNDATRKADLERIAEASEKFRSDNVYASYPNTVTLLDTYFGGNRPKDPSTNADYVYSASPGGCDPLQFDDICTSFLAEAQLEGGSKQKIYIGPFGLTTPTATPIPTNTPTPTFTLTPTPTPSNTPTPTPRNCSETCTQLGYPNSNCRDIALYPNCKANDFKPSLNLCTSGKVCCCTN